MCFFCVFRSKNLFCKSFHPLSLCRWLDLSPRTSATVCQKTLEALHQWLLVWWDGESDGEENGRKRRKKFTRQRVIGNDYLRQWFYNCHKFVQLHQNTFSHFLFILFSILRPVRLLTFVFKRWLFLLNSTIFLASCLQVFFLVVVKTHNSSCLTKFCLLLFTTKIWLHKITLNFLPASLKYTVSRISIWLSSVRYEWLWEWLKNEVS